MARYDNFACWSADLPAPSERELLEWLARFSPRHEAELQRLEWAEAEAKAKARHDRELLEFVAAISGKPEHERELRALVQKEAEEQELQEQSRPLAEAEWNEADHPRRGYGQHAGAWVAKGGGGGGAY